MIRKLYIDVWRNLIKDKEMIFVSGPRQVGKTTLSKQIARDFTNSIYFNWDIISHKRLLIKNPTFFENFNRKDSSIPLVIFDEIHKYKQWKNYLKGIYDQFRQNYRFLVTGSGRLDLYQKGGDSLAGRYLQFRLFPFTVAELSKRRSFREFIANPLKNFEINDTKKTSRIFSRLFDFGGFPEPFIKRKKTFYERWAGSYSLQIIREEIRSLKDIRDISNMEVLFSLLPSRVGAPLSIKNLSDEIGVSFGSIKNWLDVFEKFYLVFMISPWTKKISRAIKKEKKLYLFNWPEIKNLGFRFENLVAVEILRAIFTWNAYGFGRFTLHYIRNKDKQEVDFLIAEKNKPVLLIEVKFSQDVPDATLYNFQNILDVPAVQLVFREGVFKIIKNKKRDILVITAHRWLSSLP